MAADGQPLVCIRGDCLLLCAKLEPLDPTGFGVCPGQKQDLGTQGLWIIPAEDVLCCTKWCVCCETVVPGTVSSSIPAGTGRRAQQPTEFSCRAVMTSSSVC